MYGAMSFLADERAIPLIRSAMVRQQYYSQTIMCKDGKDLYPSQYFEEIIKKVYANKNPVADKYFNVSAKYAAAHDCSNFKQIHSFPEQAHSGLKEKVSTYLRGHIFHLINAIPSFDNLLIAGGIVCEALLAKWKIPMYVSRSDVDIFIYGLNEKAANAKVMSLISAFAKFINSNASGDDRIELVKNKYTMSVQFRGRKYQIIYRLYKSRSEILNSFDLGSCSVGWDGNCVF